MQRTRSYFLTGFVALLVLAIYPAAPVVSQAVSNLDRHFADQPLFTDTYNSAPVDMRQQIMLAQNTEEVTSQNNTETQLRNTTTNRDRFLNEAKDAYEAAYGLVLDEDWENAASSFVSYVEKYEGSPWQDDAQFWLCYAQEKGGMKSQKEAFECYRGFIDSFPASNWADDAKTNMIRLARTIEQSGDGSYRIIIQDMQEDEVETLVLTAIMALQSVGDAETVDALIGIYDKSDKDAVREHIIYTLSNARTQQAIDKLMDIARHDRNDDMRAMAVQALGVTATQPRQMSYYESSPGRNSSRRSERTENHRDIDIEEIARTLKDIAINDMNRSVRRASIVVLANLPSDTALDFIIDTAKTGDDYTVRRLAVEALGQSDDPRAREALIDIITSQK